MSGLIASWKKIDTMMSVKPVIALKLTVRGVVRPVRAMIKTVRHIRVLIRSIYKA